MMAQLRELKLSGMAAAFELQNTQPGTYDELAFTERLALLPDRECQAREHHKRDRLIRQARLRLQACLQDIDYQHRRNLKKAQVAQLALAAWLQHGRNLLITGPCGSGKTYLGCGMATPAHRLRQPDAVYLAHVEHVQSQRQAIAGNARGHRRAAYPFAASGFPHACEYRHAGGSSGYKKTPVAHENDAQ